MRAVAVIRCRCSYGSKRFLEVPSVGVEDFVADDINNSILLFL